ncbi:MAG: hypothetical protein JSW47_12710 [Phycisphaerales bacterium]|nr:MAG: hypothetical protein JSW47_12710 [Phycisphaerales bacterium]
MCSRKVVLYSLFGTFILLVAVGGSVYLSVMAKKSGRPIGQANRKPTLTAKQQPGRHDPMQSRPAQGGEHNDLKRRLAGSLLEEVKKLIEKGHFYEAFDKIREAYEKEPAEIKYRKLLVVLQRLSSAEFALRGMEAKWKQHMKEADPETLLSQAQKVHQRVNNFETEGIPVPSTLSAAKEQLLVRASKLVDEIAVELMEKPVREELDRAWRRLDWSGLERLAVRVKDQAAPEQSGELHKLVRITEEILRRRGAHLSAKSNCNYLKMAALLTTMMSELPNGNGQVSQIAPVGDTFSEARQWLKREWDSLMPQIQSRSGTLCNEAISLLQKYAKAPITSDEISGWGSGTDYGPVVERVELLNITHSKLTEATALMEAVPELELDCPLSLRQIESEIHRVCVAAYRKAYILENVYGDTDTAGQVHKIITILPEFENNDYPESARGWLEEHDLW